MPRYYLTALVCITLASATTRLHAQVYEYTPAAPGCSNTWQDGACWSVSPLNDPIGCTANGSWPPFVSTACLVEVIVNQDVQLTGDVLLGGTFTSLTVGNGAELTITGNLAIEGNRDILVSIEENARVAVSGELIISQGGSSDPTELYLGGDGSGTMDVGSVEVQNRAILHVQAGGAITSAGLTEYSGNSSVINVTGFFRTVGLLVTGGRQHQFNTFGDSQVIIDQDIDIRGDTGITIGGTSEVSVGGDVLVDGSATIIADEQSKIFVCGSYPTPSVGGRTQELDQGKFYPCNILPVELVAQQVRFYPESRSVRVSWTTGVEENHQYFIVERAIGSAANFFPLAEVNHPLSTAEQGAYSLSDSALPLYETRLYYRLVQVDQSSRQQILGDVLGIPIPGISSEPLVWRMYPNPVAGVGVRLSLLDQNRYNGEPLHVSVYGSVGQVVRLENKDLEGLNQELCTTIPTLPTGVYVIHLYWGNEHQRLKIIKR
ncbi:Por secretion system C-terminal sorting domain-containing protein [Cyclobacterium xiamenense]|uniref:Por secretion system C-terminal sorting domain-containing protein n=1 Tax=Cyclobacterium xiamenense TaxID=1297121 RepID=A0A1H6XQC6_9BACT|nr:T9SS type A sorting domain-containing protein [Cyclobacterium xiamenense]SEJ31273.1 Por secretion system C-terminal sorting domain-containing protein [Cyclobacterium xiamenense]